jgi:DeoR family transcriptional regulator, deoxyribose operon repressor
MKDTKAERLDRLVVALENEGTLHLKDAARLLGVSEMTIRRDIATRPERFDCYGGHIMATREGDDRRKYVFDREREAHASGKRAACETALGIIEDGDTIFLDCGTTIPHLARRLEQRQAITVVCYAINIADIVSRLEGVNLILLGGVYHRSSASFEGVEALETLSRIGINKAFLSAGGVHPTMGVSCSNFHEVAIKQTVLRKALHKYLVVDSSKFGKVRPAYFADVAVFDAIVTDGGLDGQKRDELEAASVHVITPDSAI